MACSRVIYLQIRIAAQLRGYPCRLVCCLLVEDGVDGDGRLAGLAVADDQLSLTTADGNEAVDGLQSRRPAEGNEQFNNLM